MKLLITGSSGLVGLAAKEYFREKEWEVIGIDSNQRAHFFGTPQQEGSFNVDIRERQTLAVLFTRHKFDAIIHAAAQPSHDYATDHVMEDFEVNMVGTLNLLEATKVFCPDAVFVYVSTDKVYGENMRILDLAESDTRYEPMHREEFRGFNETIGLDFAGDRSFFGCSKAAADMYAQQYGARGMKIGIFRPGCITGKNHAGAEQHGFLAYLAKCIKDEKVYKIFGFKGKQVRDQIHAYDLAAAFFEFIQNPKQMAIYNIGGGPERSISVIEAITLIEMQTGKKAIFELHEGRKGDRQWDVHDVSKFRADYPNWDYKYSLSDIIKDVCTK